MTAEKSLKLRFGNAVRHLRTAQGFSQEAFADRVGCHRTFIGGIERGERNPTLITIAKIASALNTSAEKLLRATESEPLPR